MLNGLTLEYEDGTIRAVMPLPAGAVDKIQNALAEGTLFDAIEQFDGYPAEWINALGRIGDADYVAIYAGYSDFGAHERVLSISTSAHLDAEEQLDGTIYDRPITQHWIELIAPLKRLAKVLA